MKYKVGMYGRSFDPLHIEYMQVLNSYKKIIKERFEL